MRLLYSGIYFMLLAYSLHGTYADDNEEEDDDSSDDQETITPCDREIAKILCEDEFKEKMCECAEKMPDDEKPIFYDCAKELGIIETGDWRPLLDAVCENGDEQVETAYNLIKCWNKVMNETVDKLKDNKVYPKDFFACKRKIFGESLDETSCQCQTEKRQSCNGNPAADDAKGPVGM